MQLAEVQDENKILVEQKTKLEVTMEHKIIAKFGGLETGYNCE